MNENLLISKNTLEEDWDLILTKVGLVSPIEVVKLLDKLGLPLFTQILIN